MLMKQNRQAIKFDKYLPFSTLLWEDVSQKKIK